MIGPDRIEWRRGFPGRALRLLAWAVLGAASSTAAAWILFGTEPDRLADGSANPLARLPVWTAAVMVVVLVLACVPLVRRPLVAASHYALSVRPGAFRTLLVPWAGVAEVVVVAAAGEDYLLVRLRRGFEAGGDRPTRWEQVALREAARRRPDSAGYDLAVRLREFAGPPAGNLASLAAYAPEAVRIEELR
jgi:hypothetical protein